MRKKLVPRIYALKLNISFTAGVPDCWLSGIDGDLWMENKYLQTVPPIVDPTKLLSVLQQQWLLRRHAEGRSVGVLIGSADGHLYFPSLSWLSPVTRGTFLTNAKKTRDIAEDLIEIVGEIPSSLWAELVE